MPKPTPMCTLKAKIKIIKLRGSMIPLSDCIRGVFYFSDQCTYFDFVLFNHAKFSAYLFVRR